MNPFLLGTMILARIRCDHSKDDDTARAFEAVQNSGLDLLVNSAWGGYEQMVENGQFTWSVPLKAAAQQGWINLSNSESPEFIGRVIAALAR